MPKPSFPKPPLPDEIRNFARELRQRQTDAESLMWAMLRGRRFVGLKFRRQQPIEPYILDFYCDELRLAVELDGGQHNTEEARNKDSARSAFVTQQGIEVVRYWNHEVLGDLETVFESLYQHVQNRQRTIG